MAVTTRSMYKNKSEKSRMYKMRSKNSPCRKLGRATCRRTSNCKYANGTKRSYCRKKKNQH